MTLNVLNLVLKKGIGGALKIIFSFILVLFALTANAGEFIKFSRLSPTEQEKYQKAYDAKFKIRVSKGTRCTGTYISNQGHGLTASYCITECMNDSSKLVHWPVEGTFDKLVMSSTGTIERKKIQSHHKVTAHPWSYPKVCTAVIDGNEKKIEVLAGTKGRHSEHMPIDVVFHFKQYYFVTDDEVDAYKDLWIESFYNGWGMGADFAIFKVIEDSPQKTSCLKISKDKEFTGHHYSLSYPGRTSIGSKEINTELYLSTGDVYQGNFYSSEFINIEDEEYLYLNSNLWGSPGSSGASLINLENQTISGVWSAVVGREGMGSDESKDGRFVSSKLIWKFADEVLNEIKCN